MDEYTTFSIQIPTEVADALEDEAVQKYGRKRTRNLLINQILTDRHKAKTASQPAQSRPANASRASRKVNSTN